MSGDAYVPRELPEVLADFSRVVMQQTTVTEVVERFQHHTNELLPVHGVGVLLLREGQLEYAAADTPEGAAVERLEEQLHEGPCTDAATTGEQLIVPDLEAARDRWPAFVPEALEVGVRSIHALPISARTGLVGSVDLIATEPMALTAEQLASAQLLTDVAVAYLANTRILADTTRLTNQLQEALDRRIVIEQAKGKLSERHGTSLMSAFERMRSHARSSQQPLREVAEQVLRGELDI